jgi:hypothetical protein
MTGKYPEAIDAYRLFLDRYSDKDAYSEKAQMELEKFESGAVWAEMDSFNSTEHLPLGINRPFADLAWVYSDNDLAYFTGSRKEYIPETGDSSYPTYLFTAVRMDDQWKVLDSTELQTGSFQLGATCLAWDGQSLIASLCTKITDADWRCGLYLFEKNDTGWNAPEPLSDELTDFVSTYTHPHLATMPDGSKQLLFVSDQEGGEGMMDLYRCGVDASGKLGAIENLGSHINSPFGEAAPYYDFAARKLYFSSQWYGGFGGYDILSISYPVRAQKERPEFLINGINTGYNDLFFSLSPDHKEAVITSNRQGSLSYRGEACCTELWLVNYGKPIVDSVPVPDTPLITYVDTPATVEPGDPPTKTDIPPGGETGTPKDPERPPIEQLNEMLPLYVYFHNDEPEPKTTKTTTWVGYRKAYNQYIALEEEYLTEYPNDRPEPAQAAAKDSVQLFFNDDVRQGMNDLYTFCDILEEVLAEGREVEVQIQAHCSPLALNDYNINLAKRRISSVMLFFERYNGGVFNQYAESLKLTYPANAVGEEQAPEGVNDDPNYVERSIYAPKAARERRVEIVGVIVK